jgi:hypothetical protein
MVRALRAVSRIDTVYRLKRREMKVRRKFNRKWLFWEEHRRGIRQADRFEAEILRRIEQDEKRWAKVPKSFRRIAGDLCEMDKESEK